MAGQGRSEGRSSQKYPPTYLRPASRRNAMQDIAFALGHFMEWTFKILEMMGWMPVTLTSITLFVGMLYWLNLQGKYNRKAKADGTMA